MASNTKFANATVHCMNEKLGCQWRGLFKDLEEHSTPCDKDLLRNAIISIQRLEARLDLKDRETVYLKNNFALKVEQIAKQRKLKQRDEFDRFEKVAVILKDEVEKLRVEKKEENDALKEEIEQLRKEMHELKGQHKEEIENLKETITNTPESSSSQIHKGPSVKGHASSTYFDFAVGGEPLGRVVINLFHTQAPQTCAKFVNLCTHEKGVGYRGSKVHDIRNDYCLVGGLGHLTYPTSDRVFPAEYDTSFENQSGKHDKPRLVTMTKYNDKCTKSQFLLLLKPDDIFDGVHVVIGEVTEGTWNVIEKIRTKKNGQVIITECGVV